MKPSKDSKPSKKIKPSKAASPKAAAPKVATGSVALLVSTIKGAFIFKSDTTRSE